MATVIHKNNDWITGQDATARIKFTIKDYDDTYIGSGMITTATYSLYNEADGSIINSQSAIDCSSNISATGVLTLILGTADNVLVDTSTTDRPPETHVCHFNIVGTDGDSNTVAIRNDVKFQVVDVIGA
jgi:hypothetical protein